jgi:cellulose biosynthesis protein BcsQ
VNEEIAAVAIPNSILFVNSKGGVLKSTGSAHLAGYAAAAGWDVLVIDADAQANQSRDLGYVPDGGRNLANALRGVLPLAPQPHPKWPRLHYVSGGPAVDDAVDELGMALGRGQVGALRSLERALAPLAANYHLIVIDSPPRELLLRRVLFTAGRFIVVPCQVDDGSIDGIAGILETVQDVRDKEKLNPELEVLGAFLGPIQTGADKTVRMTRNKINFLVNDPSFVLESTIRSAQSIAVYCREHGILSNEYERLAQEKKTNGKRWYKLTKDERDRAKNTHTFSEAAPRLAEDWEKVTTEIMTRFQERLAAASTNSQP